MIYFSNIRLGLLNDNEMQEWYDGNPIPNELVMHEGGVGFYFDEDFVLQQTPTGKTLVLNEEITTGSNVWESTLINCEITTLHINGTLYRDIGIGMPGTNEFIYHAGTGDFTFSTTFTGAWVMITYVQSWQPLLV